VAQSRRSTLLAFFVDDPSLSILSVISCSNVIVNNRISRFREENARRSSLMPTRVAVCGNNVIYGRATTLYVRATSQCGCIIWNI
jgi:hypothetical protein